LKKLSLLKKLSFLEEDLAISIANAAI